MHPTPPGSEATLLLSPTEEVPQLKIKVLILCIPIPLFQVLLDLVMSFQSGTPTADTAFKIKSVCTFVT